MKYIVTSDVHLGHNNTPTEHIITSFNTQVLTENNKDADVLFIAGDLFDQLKDLKSKDSHRILQFFHQLLDYCYDNQILLRVLEGTPSHDWEQSQHLVTLNNARKHKCDLVYHKNLEIEYIEKINKHVLYVPDEWTHDHRTLELQIQAKLQQLNIQQVDIAIMHGQFQYQFAGKPYKGFYFKEDYFLKLVKGYLHVGHYHTYSKLDRIIANGSLERLAHGEEAPKGYVIVQDDKYAFIENKNAYIYKTIKINTTHNLDKLDKQIAQCPKGSFIRLVMKDEHPFNVTFKELRLRYLDYHLKKDVKNNAVDETTDTYISTDTQLEFDDIFVLQSNIHQTLVNTVQTKYQLNSLEERKFMSYINIFTEVEGDKLSAI